MRDKRIWRVPLDPLLAALKADAEGWEYSAPPDEWLTTDEIRAEVGRWMRETGKTAAELSGSSGKSCGLWQEGDAGLAAWPMAPPPSPDEGVAVRIPIGRRLRDRLDHLIPGLEAPPGEGERA